jgi:hypothetical protein
VKEARDETWAIGIDIAEEAQSILAAVEAGRVT